MIEVFKTNVRSDNHAKMLVTQIHKMFTNYEANFDLDNSDNILRVQCAIGTIQPFLLIALLKDFGFNAKVLDNDCCL